ncbi:hypothetical protein ACFU99_15285 [Streptomyces sp. NPDC057654]|uniref:hypothetical protein n=1 Tax=Streptomyces sp. NPDC057654 TaxID=3346196 RepID=UPI0036C1BADD
MTFKTEWNQLRADSARRQETHTRINHVDAGGPDSGTTADLSVSSDELGPIGNDAYNLYNQLKTDGRHAHDNSKTAAANLTDGGLDTGSALDHANQTWENQVNTLLQACALISDHLDYSLAAHAKDDKKVANSMPKVEGEYLTASKISRYFH